jgi:hypothetical protein
MLKYKILIKLFVLSCVSICCAYGDTTQTEVALLCLLVTQLANTTILMLYVIFPSKNTCLKMAKVAGRNM